MIVYDFKDIIALAFLGIMIIGWLVLVIIVCLIIWFSDLRSKRNDSSSNIIDSNDAGID